MDANGTRFQLLLGADDWGRCTAGGVPLHELWQASPPATGGADVVFDPLSRTLTLRPLTFRFVAAPADVRPDASARRGAAADRFGNRYWIDGGERRILVESIGDGRTTTFWPVSEAAAVPPPGGFGPTAPAAAPVLPLLGGLAVTEDHYLVAGLREPKGLLIFDLFAGGAPTRMAWPAAIDFAPFDMAARPGGGVWILDRDRRRYWGLDRRFRLLAVDAAPPAAEVATDGSFQPLQGVHRAPSAPAVPDGFRLDDGPGAAGDPIAIEALPDGSVLILDRAAADGFSRVLRYRLDKRLGEAVSLRIVAGLIEEDERRNFTLQGHDFVLQPADAARSTQAKLIIAAAEGNQAFALEAEFGAVQLALQPLAQYLPLRRFGGVGLVLAGGTVHYDFDDGWVPLTRQHRPRYVRRAEIETRAPGPLAARSDFDSEVPDCVWHRLLLDASIPGGTAVQVFSRASNDRDALPALPWQSEPGLYRRGDGCELPWLRARPTAAARGPADLATWELLLQHSRGRFLQLKLVVTGNERASPSLYALRVWAERFSYAADYLPAVYREDAESASFVERFLANFEGTLTTLEGRIATVQALFDWRTAPADALEWLGRWFDVALDPAWDERRRRLFIRRAASFFQFRGTAHGLRMALALALDPDVQDCELQSPGRIPERRQRYRIIERYLTRRTPGAVIGDPAPEAGPREVAASERWRPREGRARLAQRYAGALAGAGTEYPLLAPVDPDNAAAAQQWQEFSLRELGFVPDVAAEHAAWEEFLRRTYGGKADAWRLAHAVSAGGFASAALPRDLPLNAAARVDWRTYLRDGAAVEVVHARRLWQDFLARRYRRVGALNDAYGTRWTSFAEVAPWDRLPPDGAALADWFRYETVARTMQRHAHRFSVLIPTVSASADLDEARRQLALARRVVELEKPAHTSFDVGFYWAMFRIGAARLGYDTLLDVGARAPSLLPSLVLGRGFIGQAHLAPPPGHPGRARMTLDGLQVAP